MAQCSRFIANDVGRQDEHRQDDRVIAADEWVTSLYGRETADEPLNRQTADSIAADQTRTTRNL